MDQVRSPERNQPSIRKEDSRAPHGRGGDWDAGRLDARRGGCGAARQLGLAVGPAARQRPGLTARVRAAMSQSWRALRLRDHFDTPSKHGVAKAWSPAGKNEGWRDYADYAPELREYNTQKKALRSQERGEPQRARSRSASPDAPGRLSRSSSRARDDALSGSWRLSYRASISRRTQLQLKQQRPKRVGQLPVFSGMATFTLRNMGITHLDGLGVHPEVTKVFLQQNWLTSFDGWEHQPNLVELHASDNCIESFK